MGGRLDMIFDTATSGVPMIRGNQVRPLAVAAPSRLADFPNVPTFAEAGYPNFEVNAWYALYVPAKTPGEIVVRLNADLVKVLRQPEVVAKLQSLAVGPSPSTAQELGSFTQAEFAKYGKVIGTANIKID